MSSHPAAPARISPGWDPGWLHTCGSQLAFPKPELIHASQKERVCVGNPSGPAGEQIPPGHAGLAVPGLRGRHGSVGPTRMRRDRLLWGKRKHPLKIGQNCSPHVSWMAEMRSHPQARRRQLRKGTKPNGKQENSDFWCGNREKMIPGRHRAALGWPRQQESGRAQAAHGEVGDPIGNV